MNKTITSTKTTRLASLGLLYASAIWGATFTTVKSILGDIDPLIMVGYRFLLAAIFLAVYLIYKKKKLFINLKAGVVLGVMLWAVYFPQTAGLIFTSAVNSAFITGMFVAFVPFLSLIIFKRKTITTQWVAMGISLLGLWALTGGLSEINLGDILTVITALAYAAHILLADRYINQKIDLYVLSFQQFLVVGIISLGMGAVFNLPFSFGTAKTGGIILFLAIFPTFSAFIIQLAAQKYIKPVRVSLLLALEPVFAGLVGWTVGGELLQINQLVGGVLIFLAIMLGSLSPNWIKNNIRFSSQ